MDLIQESREYALAEIEQYGSPIPIHFYIAEEKAIELAEKLNADKIIVKTGIVLMDLKIGQAIQEKRVNEHVAMSVKASKEFLEKFNLDQETKNKIINCVEAHHKHVPFTCIEAEICANADCYRFIHPKGFFAYLHLLGKRNSSFEDALKQSEIKLDEKYNILSLDICKLELKEYYKILKKFIAEAKKNL